MTEENLSQKRLKKLLIYDPITGIFRWKVDRVHAVKKGDVAGYMNMGYRIIEVCRKPYKAHRLAFLYMEGEIPVEVDHINHIRHDNKWKNLRPATSLINGRNASLSRRNKSGYTGVSYVKGRDRWSASIHVDGKLKFLGRFKDIDDAITVRKAANIKYGYHENHGK